MTAPVRYHHGDLRAALIARAADVVASDGLDALSLRELARDLGVSHGAPSRHFPDKQALLDALAVDGFRRLNDELAAALPEDGPVASFEDRLLTLAAVYVRFAVRNASLLALMFAAKHSREAPNELRLAAEESFATPLRAILDGQQRGELVPGRPEEIGGAILATMHGFAALVASGFLDPDDSDEALAAVMRRLVQGLRPR